MEQQTAAKQIGDEAASEINSRSAGHPPQDIVSLRLPRKRIALLDMEIDFSALPKRTPHVVAEIEAEDAG